MVDHATVDPRHEPSFWANKPGYKPVLLLVAAIIFVGLVVIPPGAPPKFNVNITFKENKD